jgi:hypothetical protein
VFIFLIRRKREEGRRKKDLRKKDLRKRKE